MSPKKKLKLDKGQQRLRISPAPSSDSNATVEVIGTEPSNHDSEESDSDTETVTDYPETSSSVSVSSAGSSSESSTHRRGTVPSWRSFGESKWLQIHPWLRIKSDGVYCQYCCHCHSEVRSRSRVFVTKPYSGVRPDKLSRHGSSKTHLQNQLAYREWQTRLATGSTVECMVERSDILTVDESAFCDAMRCMYYLNKNEIAHTTNFSGLKELCVILGNDTLTHLKKSGNTNYESEQIMGEIVEAIGVTLEEEILREVNDSPFFSFILDEATDISVSKQLGICIQYLDKNANIRVSR